MIRFLSAVIAVVALAVLAVTISPVNRPSFFYETLGLLAAGTIALYHYMVRIHKERPEIFIQFAIAVIVLKMLAYGIYVFVMLNLDKDGAVANAAFFGIAYLTFTGLGVFFVYRKIVG